MADVIAQCHVCGSDARRFGELEHAWVARCENKKCRCQFAVKKSAKDIEALHEGEREVSEPDSPEGIFEAVLQALRPRFKDAPRLLDFGAGAAPCYPVARKYGFDYTGVEFDKLAQDEALQKYGVKLVDSLEALGGAQYDLVLMSEVVEHLEDPLRVLRSLHDALRPGGILYVSTPNSECLKARLQGMRWPMYGEVHVFYFTDASLTLLLRKAGFESVSKLRLFIPIQGHSLARRLGQRLLLAAGQAGGLRYLATK